MIRLFREEKGLSLIEIIVAIAVFGIISIPITTIFMNSMETTNRSQKQMEFNSAIRIAREAVTDAIKGNGVVVSNAAINVIIKDSSNNLSNPTNVPVYGHDADNTTYSNYLYDIQFGQASFIVGDLVHCSIIMKKSNSSAQRKINFDIDTNPN